MSLGASLGRLSGEQLQEATRAAVGLSRRLKIDTTAAMRLVARAAVGDTAQLRRYGIVLEENLTPQEKFNELLNIGAESFVLAEGEAKTFGGRMQQVKNSLGDLMEDVGRQIAPAFGSLADNIKSVIPEVS